MINAVQPLSAMGHNVTITNSLHVHNSSLTKNIPYRIPMLHWPLKNRE